MNSYVTNYLVRQRVSTHVSASILEQVPVPRPARDSAAFTEMASLAARLGDGSGDRATAARLQARTAALYGLTHDEFAWVLETFPLVELGSRQAALEAFAACYSSRVCWGALHGAHVTVFEDSFRGLKRARAAQAALERIGVQITLDLRGVMTLPAKARALEEAGGSVYTRISYALRRASCTGLASRPRNRLRRIRPIAAGLLSPPAQVFAEVRQAGSLLVAQLCMRLASGGVVHVGTRGHFTAAAVDRPGLGRLNQRRAQPFATPLRLDVPTFQVADSPGPAAFRRQPDRGFKESDRRSRSGAGRSSSLLPSYNAPPSPAGTPGASSRSSPSRSTWSPRRRRSSPSKASRYDARDLPREPDAARLRAHRAQAPGDFLAEQRRARRQATDAAAARRRQLAAMRRGPRATDWYEQVWAGTTRYLHRLEARP